MVSKLSDFGISCLLIESSTVSTSFYRTMNPRGTFAYMDPEFLTTGELTARSDIYSFGIVILRLVTGKPALGIARVVEDALEKGELELLVGQSAGAWPFVQAEKLMLLGLQCAELSRRRRPDRMNHVWRVVEPLVKSASLSMVAQSFGHRFDENHTPFYFICPISQIRSENAIFQKKVLEEVGHAFQKHLGPIYCILESLQSRINVLSHAVEQIKRSDPNNYADQCLRSEENQEHADLVEEANQEQTTAVDEINQEQTAVFDGLTMSEAGKGAAVQLRFLNELESLVYTERGITAENGAVIKIAIYKDNHIIKSGPLSSARVEIVAIHGDFLDVVPNNWTEDEFNGRVVISQQGPVLGGDCQVKLKNGVASLGYVCFKKVSSKTDSGKLILAARVHSSDKPGLRVKEAVMNPVKVQVSRNESNKKSIRPKLKDDPSRLKGISRTGPPFKRLQGKKICTVEAFLKALNRDEDELCNECFELNKDSRSWRNIVKHAQECDLEGNHKLKSYISAEENVTLFFNCIHDLIGAKFRGNYRPKDKFDPDQQDLVNRLKKDAHNKLDSIEFDHVMEGNCLMPFSANVNIGGGVSFPSPVTSGTNPSDHPTMSQAIQCTVAVKTAHRSQINHPLELPDAFPNIGGGAMILEQSASELVPPEQHGTHGFQGDQSSGQMASDYPRADISGAGYCITPDISGAGYCITQSSNVPLVMAEGTPSTGNNLPGTIQNAVQHAIDVDFPVLSDLPIDSLLPANYESAGWLDPDFLSGNNPFEASTSTRNSLREHYFPQVQDQHMQHPLNAQNDGPGGSAYPGPGYGNY